MGNRLGRNRIVWCCWRGKEGSILRIVKTDGKVMKYKSPLHVRDLLPVFHGCGVGVMRKGQCYLPPDYQLMVGHQYYLLPRSATSTSIANPTAGRPGTNRMKIAVTKQQLHHMLMFNHTTLEDVLSVVSDRKDRKCLASSKQWRPRLETIPECTHLNLELSARNVIN